MKLAVITFTDQGMQRGKTLLEAFPYAELFVPETLQMLEKGQDLRIHSFSPKEVEDQRSLRDQMERIYQSFSGLLFLSATGIALRYVKDHLQHKGKDPAVLVMDEQGHHVISLLSGHAGNANQLALDIAEATGAKPVITTATDSRGMTAVDELAKSLQAPITDWNVAKHWTAKLLKAEETVPVFLAEPLALLLPTGYIQVEEPEAFLKGPGGLWIGAGEPDFPEAGQWMQLIPKRWSLGIGCRKGQPFDGVEESLRHFLKQQGIAPESLKNINTIEAKREEPALQKLAGSWQVPLQSFSAETIQKVQHLFPASDWVKENMDVTSVSAPAAYLGSKGGRVLPELRYAQNGVTLSLAPEAGLITVAGIGPGKEEHMTVAVREALTKSHRVVGYKPYVDRVSHLLKNGQAMDRSFMRKEKDRCRHALECAARGEKVLLISSGDAGVYGMAGLMLELREKEFPGILFQVLPGVTAGNAAASQLGSPLIQDYATISLSDHLIPWETIENRIQKATEADFVLVLYNPKSNERVKQWYRTIELVRKIRGPETPVGIATRALNKGENIVITTLDQLEEAAVDMSTTVIIGNSFTRITEDDLMITARGYQL